jgi:CDP-diacylglycerol---glycerol-3-phosphate 3-phosphatidyltransferase
MLTLYQYKSRFQAGLRPLVNLLAHWHISPNQITLTALTASIASGLVIVIKPGVSWPLLSLPVVLFGRMALNAIDGMLAREHDQTTLLGGVLNELGDVIADACLYLPFCLIPGIAAPWIVSIVILAIVSELAGVLGLAYGCKRGYEGPMGKSDRAFVFGAVALMLGLGIAPFSWLNLLWGLVVGLQVWTTINRVMGMLQEATS